MTARAKRHDPCVTCRGERVVEPEREREMAEVVGRKLELPAIWGQRERRQGHPPRVVDQEVQRPAPAGGERRDRRLVGEIEPPDVYSAAGGGRYVAGRPVTGLRVTHG